MVISAQQMAKLNAAFNQQYEAGAARHLTGKYADWVDGMQPEEVMAFVSTGVQKAAQLDVRACKDVTAFLEYAILLGNDFWKGDAHEWVTDIFNIRNITGAEKMSRMATAHPID